MARHNTRVDELARELGCSQETIRRMARQGQIPRLKVRNQWRFDREAVILALSHDPKLDQSNER